jgi:hypothetical protein
MVSALDNEARVVAYLSPMDWASLRAGDSHHALALYVQSPGGTSAGAGLAAAIARARKNAQLITGENWRAIPASVAATLAHSGASCVLVDELDAYFPLK